MLNRGKRLAFVILAALLISGCAASKPTAKPVLAPHAADVQKDMNPDAYNHYTNAIIYEQEQIWDEAIKEYEVALSYEPLSYDIRMALGLLYFNMNRTSQALDALLPIPEKTGDTYKLLGDCYRQLNRDDEAWAVYRRALVEDSNNVSLNYNLGLLAAKQRKLDEAAKYFQVAAHYSGNAVLFQQIAEMYAGIGMFDSATVLLERAITLNTEDPSLYSRLSVYYHAGGKKLESKNALYRGVRNYPNDARLRAQLIETYNSEDNLDSVAVVARQLVDLSSTDKVIYERIGQVLMKAKLDTLAEASFKKALAIDSTSRYAMFYLGRMAIDRKEYDSAKTYFSRLVGVDSTTPDGWVNLAFVFEQEKQPDKSMAILQQALMHVTADRDNVQFYLAQLLANKQMSDSSMVLLKQIIAEGGDTIRALFLIGVQYEHDGNFDKTVETFELLLSIDSTNAQALNYLGYTLADKGVRLDESLRMIQKAVATDTANGAYLDSYAWVLYRLGRYNDALTEIQKALTLIKDDATVLEHLGDIQMALGNADEARNAWQASLRVDPKNEKVKAKLNK
jgi:tetratricopeptide (TPR) repeat protein